MQIEIMREWHRSISDQTTKRHFKSGEVIAIQGEEMNFVGYILSGRAKAVSFSQNGTATWVGHFEADDFFGHVSLLNANHPPFEISAETDIEAIIIRPAVMRDLMAKEKELGLALVYDLAARLDLMTRRLIDAYSLSAKGRVCAELARLSNVIGIMPEKNIIRPNPVLVDLALRVNSTRETVSRTVSDLQKKGIISRQPGALIIEKPEQLKAGIQ